MLCKIEKGVGDKKIWMVVKDYIECEKSRGLGIRKRKRTCMVVCNRENRDVVL